MLITITINTDNAAFEDIGPGHQTAEILRDWANKIDGMEPMPFMKEPLRDLNGTVCGEFRVTES